MSDERWKTAITKVEPNKIMIRGYPVDQLMGKISYAQGVYLLLKGELPTDGDARLLEAVLVSSLDHGATPPSVLTALTVASTGAELNACVAAGILAISRWHGGAIEECMKTIGEALARKATGKTAEEAAAELVGEYRLAKKRMSGFGHRLHTNDPRTARLIALAKEGGRYGESLAMAVALEGALEKASGKKLPLNVDGAIAAVLAEMGFAPSIANALFMMSRLPGLVAHVQEERERQRPMRKIHPTEHEYDGPPERSL